MKKILSLILILTLSVSVLAGCGGKKGSEDKKNEVKEQDQATSKEDKKENSSEAIDNDAVVLTVNEDKMTKKEANVYLYSTKLNVEQMGMGSTIWVNEVQEGKTFEALQLEQLKNTITYFAVLKAEAEKQGIKLTDEEKNSFKENVNGLLSALPQEVKDYYGFDEKVFEDFFATQQLTKEVFDKVMENYVPDENKLKELYEADETYKKIKERGYDHYFDKVRARHILIRTLDDQNQPLPEDKKAEAKKKAEDILVKAKAGEDFAELAKEYSEDPGSKDNGGEYTFPRGQMVPAFEEKAFSLNPGEISDLVETNYGYHIIKLEEKIASTPEDVEKAKGLEQQIKDGYIEQLKAEAFQQKYEEIKKNYDVKINEDVFDSMSLSYTVPVEETNNAVGQNNEKKEEK